MLKRFLLAVALAASTLFVSGSITAAQADANACAPPQQSGSTTAQRCEWRGNCYWCYYDGDWHREYCR
ncbi:hypothetical protein [Nonomuraea sp. SYSU D8015]|uniref:hypothetical protein n=1 Tax=Nonomuraea sp. SYSU D8015 TaxID=2593644 RepID=UPI0016610846|nr:hypothetical protein [Nonomuraea sp. SYSU D8015]